jgi:alpha-glucosidase
MRNALWTLLIMALTWTTPRAQTAWTLSSPNGKVAVSVKQEVVSGLYAGQLNLYYRVTVGDSLALDWSPLGIKTSTQDFITGLAFTSRSDSQVNDTYALPTGKRSTYVNRANQSSLNFKNANDQTVSFVLRAYDDAFAFRYILGGTGSATVTGEQSGFNLPIGSVGWVQGYSTSYENTYDKGTVGTNLKTGDIGFPSLFQTPSQSWVLISEAAVYGEYCASRLAALTGVSNVLMVKFPQATLTSTLPWATPWRVVVVGNSLAPIVETSVIEHLNPPNELTDLSWIKPGRAAWSWLSQNTGTLAQQKTYTTFARQMTWEYNLIDDGFDKTQMPALSQFSADSGVGMELWYRYSDLNTQAKEDTAFTKAKGWGVKSLKIDFIENDNQATMKWFEMTAKNLARYGLMATYHGVTIPRGERRRWPHIMTYEGVRGDEYYGRGYPGAAHNATVPFTRNVIGPMDITPVLFTTTALTNGTPTERTSTDAHELALSVLYESGILHFADKPASYQASIGLPFLKTVPAAWDDIRYLDGYPGQTTLLARRKGNDWYVAGITALTASTMTVPLSFLKSGSYSVELYRDSAGTARTMTKETITLNPSVPLSIPVNTKGGFVFKVANSYQPTALRPNGPGRKPGFRHATTGQPFDLLGRPLSDPDLDKARLDKARRTTPQATVRRPQ